MGQLSEKTGSLEEQLENLARLLSEARGRLDEKAQQLEHAEVCKNCEITHICHPKNSFFAQKAGKNH